MSPKKSNDLDDHITLQGIMKTLKELENCFSNKFNKLEEKLSEHISSQKELYLKLSQTIELLEKEVNVQSKKIDSLELKYSQLNKQFVDFKKEVYVRNLAQEHYSKRMNVLIHGIEEQPRENKEQTKKIVCIFSKKCFTGKDIKLIDCHSLSSASTKIDSRRSNWRPIICKVSTMEEKFRIFSSLVVLKDYNKNNNSGIFLTNHLPKPIYLKKKRLIPIAKQAKASDKTVQWVTSPGDINLIIDGSRAEFN